MTTSALQTAQLADAPKLRLLPTRPSRPAPPARVVAPRSSERPALRLVHDGTLEEYPVLIAGRDPAGRAAVLHELIRTMPADTTFEEAGAFWEVLVRAPAVSMVILSGELDEVPAEALLGMLAHRHPDLPVVSLDAPAPVGADTRYF
jgi:hypothetical protein